MYPNIFNQQLSFMTVAAILFVHAKIVNIVSGKRLE